MGVMITKKTLLNNAAFYPSVQGNFAASLGDYREFSTTSQMPSNLLSYSEQFDNAAWLKSQASISANSIIAPDGTLTGDKLIESSANGEHVLYRSLPNNKSLNTLSVYVKAGERSIIRLVGFGATPNNFTNFPYAYFNISTGTVSSSSNCNASIINVGNGWYRCIISATNTDSLLSDSVNMFWAMYMVSTGTTFSYQGDGVSGFYVWGAQLEQATTVSSYVPTTASAVSSLLSLSRAGLAMQYDSTGKLTYAPNNLLLRSQEYTAANWGKGGTTTVVLATGEAAPDGTATAYRVEGLSTVDPDIGLSQNITTTPIRVVGSLYVKGEGANIGKNIRLQLKRVGGTLVFSSVDVTLSGSWQRVSANMAMLSDNTGIQFILSGAAASNQASTCLIWGAQLEAVTYQTTPGAYVATTSAAYYGPRFDYNPATLTAKGLLVEGARTNYFTYSQDMSNAAWSKFGVTITGNAGTAPDGTNSAFIMVEDTANGSHNLFQAHTATLNVVNTVTIYAKSYNGTRYLYFTGGGLGGASEIPNFDLTNGTVDIPTTTTYFKSASITPVGNGWYRCVMTFVPINTNLNFGISQNYTDNTSSGINYTGNGVSGIYVWGAQIEVGEFSTSFIRTAASTVTRAADSLTLANYTNRLIEAFWIDQQTGISQSFPEAVVSSGSVTISPPTFGWVTSLRAYNNAYAGDIAIPSWIDNSETTGNRMYYDSTGTLTWAPANMVAYSEDFRNTTDAGSTRSWLYDRVSITPNATTAPDGTLTADLETLTGVSYAKLTQNIVFVSGTTYIYSVYVKAGTASSVTLRMQGYTISSAVVVSGPATAGASGSGGCTFTNLSSSAWSRIAIVATANTNIVGEINIYVGNWDNQTIGQSIYVWGAQLEPVTYQTAPRPYIPTTSAAVYQPRFDYDPATLQPRGMLIEESRVNMTPYSQSNFSSGFWTKNDSTINSDVATIAPDGTNTGSLLRPTTTNSYLHLIQTVNAITVTNATAYTWSWYVKAAGYNWVAIAAYNNGISYYTWFNLINGTVGTSAAGNTATITNVGNGWYRISVTRTTANTVAYNILYVGNADNLPTFAGDGVSGVYIWGAQLEAGSFATSYIPTVASSVTRVADSPTINSTIFSTSFSSLKGSYISQFRTIWTGTLASSAIILEFDNANNRIFSIFPGANVIVSQVSGSNDLTAPGSVVGTISRAALGYDTSGRSIVSNGGTVVTSTVPFPTNLTLNRIGQNFGSASMNGYIQSLAYYNRRLPDTVLKAKSVVGATY